MISFLQRTTFSDSLYQFKNIKVIEIHILCFGVGEKHYILGNLNQCSVYIYKKKLKLKVADSTHIILESEKKSTTVQETSYFLVTFLDNKLYDTMF